MELNDFYKDIKGRNGFDLCHMVSFRLGVLPFELHKSYDRVMINRYMEMGMAIFHPNLGVCPDGRIEDLDMN